MSGKWDSLGGMDRLWAAARDVRYLLERGYPRAGAVTYVGNHYQLPRVARDVLTRGVYPDDEAARRRDRLAGHDAIRGRAVGIDGHNILITIENALTDQILVRCDDGPVRDVAGASAGYRPGEATDRALDLILDALTAWSARGILFLFDAPMAHSGDLAAEAEARLGSRGLMGRARAVPVPEVELTDFRGLVATSDSVLIDRVESPIDLAGLIIAHSLPEAAGGMLPMTPPDGPWGRAGA